MELTAEQKKALRAELAKHAPRLFNCACELPFRHPRDYFDHLGDVVEKFLRGLPWAQTTRQGVPEELRGDD